MKSLALVIGNANYTLPKNQLINAVNDALDVADKLTVLGFEVIKKTDCTTKELVECANDFGNRLLGYHTALFYFSGHGLQIDGKNYLTGVDTSFADSTSAKYTSCALDMVLEYIQEAGPEIKILILDACRDNPLPQQYRSVQSQGLAPIHAPKGTLIAFSTSPGEKAMDYGAGRNSIYTGSFLNHIDDENIPIEDFFKRVRTTVYTLSGGKQTSWEHTSLIGTYSFNTGQRIFSVDIPYPPKYVADAQYIPDDSTFGQIISDFRSRDFYIQGPAIRNLKNINSKQLSEGELFLLGRNLLQTAEGGEYAARGIMNELPKWLDPFFTGKNNHVLNGLFFEIYFDKNGNFRKENFKCSFLEQIFGLERLAKFQPSFLFINKCLKPYADELLYFPSHPLVSFPIEVIIKRKEYQGFDGTEIRHILSSVKHENMNLMPVFEDTIHNSINIEANDLRASLAASLAVPLSHLTVTSNIPLADIEYVLIPWNLRLSKQPS